MSVSAFTDKLCRPSNSEVAKSLGSSYQRWLALIEHLRHKPGSKEDFAFLYGKGYGWALRFRLKGKLLTSLFPNEGYFAVQVNLTKTQLSKVGRMRLHRNALAAIERATLYAEGKWTFTPVRSDVDLKDVFCLIELKSAGTATSS
jgi:hypothetical protein